MPEDDYETPLFEFALDYRGGFGVREGADSHFIEAVAVAFEYERREIVLL